MSGGDPLAAARRKSLDLLARREHSRAELRGKLGSRGFDAELVERVLDELCAGGWLSDRRFAEQYTAARRARGYGPLRIRDELKLRGVDDGISSACIDARASDWHDEARLALARRFREPGEPNPAERAKRARFLARRGYDSDQIRTVLDCGD